MVKWICALALMLIMAGDAMAIGRRGGCSTGCGGGGCSTSGGCNVGSSSQGCNIQRSAPVSVVAPAPVAAPAPAPTQATTLTAPRKAEVEKPKLVLSRKAASDFCYSPPPRQVAQSKALLAFK